MQGLQSETYIWDLKQDIVADIIRILLDPIGRQVPKQLDLGWRGPTQLSMTNIIG